MYLNAPDTPPTNLLDDVTHGLSGSLRSSIVSSSSPRLLPLKSSDVVSVGGITCFFFQTDGTVMAEDRYM